MLLIAQGKATKRKTLRHTKQFGLQSHSCIVAAWYTANLDADADAVESKDLVGQSQGYCRLLQLRAAEAETSGDEMRSKKLMRSMIDDRHDGTAGVARGSWT